MNYDPIDSVPIELRTFIEDERRRQEAHFNLKLLEMAPEERPAKFNPQLWMKTIRKTFTHSVSKAYNKAVEVTFIMSLQIQRNI